MTLREITDEVTEIIKIRGPKNHDQLHDMIVDLLDKYPELDDYVCFTIVKLDIINNFNL